MSTQFGRHSSDTRGFGGLIARNYWPPRVSAVGRVSRAPQELSATRNCTRDEGGPFEFGDQEPISSHRKLLRAKSRGGERCGNTETRFRQARSREASASEPLRKCRKRIRRCQNRGVTLPPGSARGDALILPERRLYVSVHVSAPGIPQLTCSSG